jgi:hypothetical protein
MKQNGLVIFGSAKFKFKRKSFFDRWAQPPVLLLLLLLARLHQIKPRVSKFSCLCVLCDDEYHPLRNDRIWKEMMNRAM